MKIDLRKLNTLREVTINDSADIPKEYYNKTDIIRIENLKVEGIVYITQYEEIELNINVTGTFILPCSISLEEVEHDFETEVNDILVENDDKNQFSLDISDILWENIVSEVPMKVTKPNVEIINVKGSGWELEIE